MPVTALQISPSRPPAALRQAAVRDLLRERFPDAVPLPERAVPALDTGLTLLDQLLPSGGLPRARVVVWRSEGGGATALLRSAAGSLVERGERVAWVDGRRSLGAGWLDGPLVVRPSSPDLALTSAEILLRSGGFALVVLTGVEPDQHAMLRLSRMVHEGGGAFVAVTSRTLTASLRLASRFVVDRFRWTTGPFGNIAAVEAAALEVSATAPGWSRATLLSLPALTHDLRLALDPLLADRRGDLG